MPKYLFYCDNCRKDIEFDIPFDEYSSENEYGCPTCKYIIRRKYLSANFILKGKGFVKGHMEKDNEIYD